MQWISYVLVFIFGYFTCKTFYFMSSTRLSVSLVRLGHLISLGIIARSFEDLHATRVHRLEHMLKSEESAHNINALNYRFEDEIARFKKRSIQQIVDLHPTFFKNALEFDDWPSAMKYLNAHKYVLYDFLAREETND